MTELELEEVLSKYPNVSVSRKKLLLLVEVAFKAASVDEALSKKDFMMLCLFYYGGGNIVDALIDCIYLNGGGGIL